MNDTQHSVEEMQEEELLDLIRDTVGRLNALGDKLEHYAAERTTPPEGD